MVDETARARAREEFLCVKLHCTLSVRICIARQIESAASVKRPEPGVKRTCGTREAIVPTHPHCLTERCEQGREWMQATAREAIGTYRTGQRSDLDEQYEARRRQESVLPPEPDGEEP